MIPRSQGPDFYPWNQSVQLLRGRDKSDLNITHPLLGRFRLVIPWTAFRGLQLWSWHIHEEFILVGAGQCRLSSLKGQLRLPAIRSTNFSQDDYLDLEERSTLGFVGLKKKEKEITVDRTGLRLSEEPICTTFRLWRKSLDGPSSVSEIWEKNSAKASGVIRGRKKKRLRRIFSYSGNQTCIHATLKKNKGKSLTALPRHPFQTAVVSKICYLRKAHMTLPLVL